MRFPSIKDVARELASSNRLWRLSLDRDGWDQVGEDSFLDIRLQVLPDGSWALHEGDPQYDTDHRGYWGAGTLDGKRFNSREMARDLIEQAREQRAQEEA
jgi:hypothetical protein